MPESSVRVLTARLDDLEEKYDKALKDLREAHATGSPAKIEAAEEKVDAAHEKVLSADEEIAAAKATLKKHGYELDEGDEPAPTPEGAPDPARSDPPAMAAEEPGKEPPKEPAKPKPPKPDEEPVVADHWYSRTI